MSKTTVQLGVNVMKPWIKDLRDPNSSITSPRVRRLLIKLASEQDAGPSHVSRMRPVLVFPDNPDVRNVLKGFFKNVNDRTREGDR